MGRKERHRDLWGEEYVDSPAHCEPDTEAQVEWSKLSRTKLVCLG